MNASAERCRKRNVGVAELGVDQNESCGSTGIDNEHRHDLPTSGDYHGNKHEEDLRAPVKLARFDEDVSLGPEKALSDEVLNAAKDIVPPVWLKPGQISKIYLENFACHHSLTVEFDAHVNLVTGIRESGKRSFGLT